MSTQIIHLTKHQARELVLKKQLLCGARTLKGKKGTQQAIEHLGYLQIDTISVIERSHHIVLYTRCPTYKHKYLHELQTRDRKIFEYWAHAASFVPMSDYRFYLRKMKEDHVYESWMSNWSKEHRNVIRSVRKRITHEGALSASDFADLRNRKRGPWWDWKPAKAALEILFWRGELMIKERKNFQRVYDLTERILPDNIDTTMPGKHEERCFFVKRALKAMGIATIQDINRYVYNRNKLNDTVKTMLAREELHEVRIKGIDKTYYLLPQDVQLSKRHSRGSYSSVRFLSPFDNAIILRDRTNALFNFKYALECYTPPKNRKYGYFCLPVLWRNQLVGRFDPKADRARNELLVRSIYVEKPELVNNNFFKAFSHRLAEFADFHGCHKIAVKKVVPSKFRKKFMRHI